MKMNSTSVIFHTKPAVLSYTDYSHLIKQIQNVIIINITEIAKNFQRFNSNNFTIKNNDVVLYTLNDK